jgi:hypothetical protein
MRLAIFCLSVLVLAGAASAQTAKPMTSTAPEKMMPAGEARKMRACDKMAMDQKIKMEDRAKFVADCMAKMK